MNLLDREKLLASPVVANNRMNRERGVAGGNSYGKELAFDVLGFLNARLHAGRPVSWLDIACGEGRALIEAAVFFAAENPAPNLEITGIDLAGLFQKIPAGLDFLKLLETPFEDFEPAGQFDLVTSVHGLHYFGDKLSAVRKAASRLKPGGVFRAHLELCNLKLTGRKNANRAFAAFFRREGFAYDPRKRILSRTGPQSFELPFEYRGADDRPGPNSTGQPVVDSYYKL